MNNILYEMTIENPLVDAVFAISLVDKPAIEENFVTLSKDTVHIDIQLEKTVDMRRKVVSGPILVPDKVIPRDGYNIVFSKDTVRQLSENFLMDGNKDNVTIQHKMSVNKVKLIESWIVDNSEYDKSKVLGMELPVGTWCGSFKVLDDNLWSEYLESGVLKGFSLEGHFSQKEVHMHSEKCSCGHNHEEEDIEELLELSKLDGEDKLLYDIYHLVAAGTKRGGGSGSVDTTKYFSYELDEKYRWEVRGDNDCPVCERNNGKVFSLKNWLIIGLPRVPNNTNVGSDIVMTTNYRNNGNGPYATFCETDCKCKLVKVEPAKQATPSTPTKSKPKNPYAKDDNYVPKYKRNPDYDPTRPLYSILPTGGLNTPFIYIN